MKKTLAVIPLFCSVLCFSQRIKIIAKQEIKSKTDTSRLITPLTSVDPADSAWVFRSSDSTTRKFGFASIRQVGNVSGSDFTTTNTTATDITGLSFAVLANETWEFDAYLKVGSSSAAGIQIAVNTPASPTIIKAYVLGQVGSNTAFAEEELSGDASLTTTAFNTAALTTAAVGAFIHVHGLIVNGSNAGNVFIDIAKVTSGTATVYLGSHLNAIRK